MHTTKKLAALTAAAGLVTIGFVATSSPASASGMWYPAIGSTVVSTGDQFTGSGSLVLNGTYNGAATSVTCSVASGALTWTVPSPVPSAAPGGTLTLSISVPTNLAPAHATCTDSVTGSPVNVTTTGASWTATVTVPSGTTPNPNTGPFNGTISIPANSITADLTGLPGTGPGGVCRVVGPTSAFNGTGTYNGSTGVLGVSPADQAFNLNNTLCTNGGTTAKLHSGTATLTKVGGSSHPDLFYQ